MSGSFLVIVAVVAVFAGASSAVTAAGIGTLLVPLLALRIDPKTAVAITAAPHLVGLGIRAWQLRRQVDRRVLLRFGAVCAVASLTGAVLHNHVPTAVITYMFAGLLVVAGIATCFGIADRVHLGKRGGAIAGALSGFFGGMTGEQGGVRAVGLLPFDLSKEAFVATSTAVGVVVDVCRMPVYVVGDHAAFGHPISIAVMTGGVIVGTFAGARVLDKIPDHAFERVLGGALILIGALLVLKR